MDSTISSFLVALGFEVNQGSLNNAKKSVADYEKAVVDAEEAIEDARWKGANTQEEVAKLSREANLKEARAALAAAQEREKAEKDAAQKRQERNKEFISGLSRLALAATAAATAISYAVNRVTQSFDHLGFVSARTGSSVQNLNSLAYAFKQVGGSSQQAIGLVENFAKAIRENSGVKGFVESLGVDMTKDASDQVLDTFRVLQTHGYDAGSREAALAGISEENYKLLTQYVDQLDRYRDEYNKLTGSLGVNSKEAADASMAFQRSLTRLQATASALGDKLMVSLAPALQGVVDKFQAWISANPEKVEHIMKGISDALIWLAEKVKQFVEYIAGGNGDEMLKRWDAFAGRVERVAHNVERIVSGLAKLFGFVERLSGYGTGVLGNPRRTAELLDGLRTGQDGGAGVVVAPGGPAGPVRDTRTWYERHAPTILGGKPDPNAPASERSGIRRRGDRNAEAFGRLNPRPAEGPGKYRPQYNVGEADLSQRTADIIAGEAIRKNPESIDAVINNMLNRVGSKGWGPSKNLLDVATAPGQYEAAWKGAKASPAETEFIRSRIKAIASGGVPDNTKGANSYRAESYYRGEGRDKTWAKTLGINGTVVGGNRYTYDPSAANGPYAPYATPKDVLPPKAEGAKDFPVKITAPKIEVKGGDGGSNAAPEIHLPGVPRMMQMPGFDAKDYMKPAPEASPSVVNNGGSTSKVFNQTFNQKTTVSGAENPRQAAAIMESAFGRMHNLALANAQSATV